jgi:hypothetical protein
MTGKVGLIKNPLTIIAIFAGIAEVSGTIVLPFVSDNNQELFIYFLICFPSILVLFFFVTLNFNNKVLYAPSDYKDEANYIKINKYDIARQKNIELKIPKDNQKYEQFLQLTEKVNHLNNQISRLEAIRLKEKSVDKTDDSYVETFGTELLVTNFDNVNIFIENMKEKGLDFEIYQSHEEDYDNSLEKNRAIWLGSGVLLELAKRVIKHSKELYPHLKYIKVIQRDGFDNENIYIGGSTKSAIKLFNQLPISDTEFDKIQSFNDINSLHEYLEEFKK